MRWLLAFLLTCFATFLVGALAFGIVVRGATPNPRVTIAPDGHTLTVLCGPRDGQPRPPFSCKDRIDQQQLDLEAIVRWWQAPPLYEPVAYDVSHANRPYAIVRATPNREPLNFKIQDAADDLNKALLMFLGILVIAKGRGSVSLPAGLFLFGIVAGSGINPSLVELPYWLVIAVHSLRQAFVSISLFCLSLVALEITDAVSRKGRATVIVLSATLNFGCVFPLLLFGSVFLPLRASEHAYSHNVAFTTLFYGLPLLAKLLPLVMLAYAVARPKPKDAGLARWILASTLIGFSGPIVKELSSTLGMHDRSLAPLVLTESVMAFGYGYALIQHHLVDVNFALVRAAVLGTIGLALSGLDQYVSEIIDDRSGLNVYRFISFVAVLAIGMSIRFIEPRLDGIFDRFAFTRRYRMQCGLRSLCKDGAEATDAGVLAHLVATQLRRLIELESVAVYECHGDSFIPISIDSLNQSPAIPFVALSKNDQAILRMTSQPSATEMIGIETALPSNSIAFPMVAGGRLIGVVVCMRQQALTYYDRDVRRMVERFVCTIGSMLVFLRSRYCERYPEPRVRSHRSSRAAFAGAASDPR